MDHIYFEEIEIPSRIEGPSEITDKDEMVAFAKTWDPLPIHIDEEAAAAHGGLTASGAYILALRIRLIHKMPRRLAVIASLGYDEVRFKAPAHAGDRLTLVLDNEDKRPSKSKPDRGVVMQRQSLVNQDGVTVMTLKDALLVQMKPE